MTGDGHCDALVFFGATGDLAYKQIFPALQSMIRHRHLEIPVIGVAKSGWRLEDLRRRARESLAEHGDVDDAAFAKLASLLRYIDGDYADPATFDALRRELGEAARPLHYLAIPPNLFARVVRELGRSGGADGARVVVEKPFGHDLASARALNGALGEVFPKALDLSHRPLPRQGGGREPPLLPLRQLVPRADLEPRARRARADHHGRELRRGRAWALLRRDRCDPRRRAEPHAAGGRDAGDGPAVRARPGGPAR